MKEILEEQKKLVLICVILLIAVLMLFFIQIITQTGTNHKKVEGNDYVYTEETNVSKLKKTSYLPMINLDFKDVEQYNKDIQDAYYILIQNEENSLTYNYTIHKNVLFLLLKFYYYDDTNNQMETTYKSFNIDLKTGKLIQNEELLKKYGYEVKDVSTSVKNKMQQYYRNVIKKGYIDSNECDFSCFLIHHNINEDAFEGNVSLFYENKDLIIYRSFTLETVYNDKGGFPVDAFRMEIKES